MPVVHRLDDALGDAGLVVVASPTSLHRHQAAAAVAAGCHVLVEKPVGDSSAGLEAVADAAADRGLVAAAAHQFRFEPGLVALHDMVAAGELGTILTVEAHQGEHLADYHPDEDYRVGYAARRALGGGVLRTQIHHIDALDWIFGPLTRVFASGGHRTDLEVDVEDTASYLFLTADGTPVHGHLDFRQRPKHVSMVVVGSEGRVDWDHYAGRLVHTPFAPGAEPVERAWAYDRLGHVHRSVAGPPRRRAHRVGASDPPPRRHPRRQPRRSHRALDHHRRGGQGRLTSLPLGTLGRRGNDRAVDLSRQPRAAPASDCLETAGPAVIASQLRGSVASGP